MNNKASNLIDSDDFDCDIDDDQSDHPSSSSFSQYGSFTNSSKLIQDKGKVSCASVHIFVEGLKAKAKFLNSSCDSANSGAESPKINHLNFNMCSVYDKMRHKKSKLKSLFSKKSSSKQRCRSKLVKKRKFKSNIDKKEICVSNGRSTSLTPPPSKFIRKSGVSKGVI